MFVKFERGSLERVPSNPHPHPGLKKFVAGTAENFYPFHGYHCTRLTLIRLPWIDMGFRTSNYFAVQSKVTFLNEFRYGGKS